MDFCKCGSIMTNGKCTNEHCPGKNQKCKAWVVDGVAMNFKKVVLYKDAADLVRRMNSK